MTAISRRRIMQLLGAALAATVVVPEVKKPVEIDPPRSTWAGKTRWIGHC